MEILHWTKKMLFKQTIFIDKHIGYNELLSRVSTFSTTNESQTHQETYLFSPKSARKEYERSRK